MDVGGLPKIGDTFFNEISDVSHHVIMKLPEHLSHLEASVHEITAHIMRRNLIVCFHPRQGRAQRQRV